MDFMESSTVSILIAVTALRHIVVMKNGERFVMANNVGGGK